METPPNMAPKETPKEVKKVTTGRTNKMEATMGTTHLTVSAVEGAYGVVVQDGSFECHLTIRGNMPCGARMKNGAPNIRSHISKKHREDSSYKENQRSGSWFCTWDRCKRDARIYPNFNSLLAHVRTIHRMRGPSGQFKKKAMEYSQKMVETLKEKKGSTETDSDTDIERQDQDDPLFVDDMPDYPDQKDDQEDQEDHDPPAMGPPAMGPILAW